MPFPNNVIPANRINPAITYWLNTMIPLPNRPGLTDNYVNTQSSSNDRDSFNVRGDHSFGPKDNVSVRWSRQRVGLIQPGGNPYLYSQIRYDVDNMMASWNHVFSATSPKPGYQYEDEPAGYPYEGRDFFFPKGCRL